MFKTGIGHEDSWAHIKQAKILYTATISEMALHYRSFREKISLVQQLLGYNDEGLYEQLKTDVRVKSMSILMNFYSVINKFYDQTLLEQVDESFLGFKSIKDLNYEVFGCAIDINQDGGSENEVNIIA